MSFGKNYKKIILSIIFGVFISLSQAHALDFSLDTLKYDYNFFLNEIVETTYDNFKTDINNYLNQEQSSFKTDINYFVDQKKAGIGDEIIDIINPILEEKKEEMMNLVDSEIEQKKKELNEEIEVINEQLAELGEYLEQVGVTTQKNADLWSRILSMGEIVLLYIVYLITIVVILKICVLLFKLIGKLILFYIHDKPKPLQFQDKLYTPKIKIRKSINVRIKNDFYVRYNSILKYGNTSLSKGWPFGFYNLFAYFKGLYMCDKVSSGAVTITSPNHFSYLSEIIVPKGGIFVFNLANLVAFEKGIKIKTKRRIFSLSSILEKKFRFHYIEGPAKLYLYGVGEIVTESITQNASYEKNTIIGFSGNLKRNISIVEKLLFYLFSKNSLKENFTGKGYIIRQKFGVTDKQLRKLNKSEGGWFGFVSDVVGLVK